MLVELEQAFVLNTRLYRETSLLVDFFSKNFGKITLVAKGVRKKKSKTAGLIQPFIPILISYFGKSTLCTLKNIEQDGVPCYLSGVKLLSGFYLNELLIKLLAVSDPYPNLFDHYKNTLLEIQSCSKLEPTLRYFEKQLLKNIGYELQLTETFDTREQVSPDKNYHYILGHGVTESDNNFKGKAVYSGDSLLALDNNSLISAKHISESKKLMRAIITYYLDGKTLNVRSMMYS